MIKLRKITKQYDSATALADLSLDIPGGKTTVLIGPSGCGKSTLIRIIVGLIRADSGKVLIHNEALGSSNVTKLRRNIGYVIQEGGLFPHLTAKQNVSLLVKYLGWRQPAIDERINELAALTKFPPDGLDRFPLQLSGGQNQRISLMRALMPDPEILLLDEPLGALDPLIRYDLQNDLKSIFIRNIPAPSSRRSWQVSR